jgi:hypothetical protein
MRSTQQPTVAIARPSAEREGNRELRELRLTCWRQQHEIHGLRDTVAILRAGANRLAADNAFMHAERVVAGRSKYH